MQTHVHFPATAGEVEKQGYFELAEGLQVLTETLSRKLLERVLIALGSLLHLPLLWWEDTHARTNNETYKHKPFKENPKIGTL